MFEDIKEQFKKVIQFSQDIENPDVDLLFEKWYQSKKRFIDAWDGKLIYEHPQTIQFSLDEKAKTQQVEAFAEVVYDVYNNSDLSFFIEENQNSFYTNRVEKPYELEDGRAIPAGMKLVKAFKYFETDRSTLNEIQMKASEIIQQDKIEGTLCISVHPLDYLSVSQNTYNWRSCHALDGDYRAGNLEYMMDNSTIVCYLKGADNVKIPLFPDDVPWNSKKWRCLFFVSEGISLMFAGRQYPFISWKGLDLAQEVVLESLKEPYYRWSEWHSPLINTLPDKTTNFIHSLKNTYILIRKELFKLEDIIIEESSNPLFFNDLLRSSCYTPVVSIKNNHYPEYNFLENDRVFIGVNSVPCLQCGEEEITDSALMRCTKCELEYGTVVNETYAYCSCCDCRIVREESYNVNTSSSYDYEEVCESCFKSECFICESCGEIYYNSDKRWDPKKEEYVCKYCFDEGE